VAAVEIQPAVIWGLSVNLDSAALGSTSADLVFEETMALAGALGLPVMLGTGSVESTDVMRHIESLRSGDILTYLFRGGDASLFGSEESIETLRRAQRRGVVLDASHGAYSFDDRVARQAMAQGVVPDSISSDTSRFTSHLGSFLQHRALARTVAAGLGIEQAIMACSLAPGSVLGLEMDWPPNGKAGDFDVIRWSATPLGAIGDLELLAVMRSGHLTIFQGEAS
jgi:dihydroorotase